jgi:hypothetical protein
VSPDRWRLEDGTFNSVKKNIFGYGAVVYWPKDIIPLPEAVNDITSTTILRITSYPHSSGSTNIVGLSLRSSATPRTGA